MSAIARILDANANRAREALRVMEDAARLALNDEPLTRELKSLRHDLRAAMDCLPSGWLEANRDTPGDVGTRLSTASESTRDDLPGVVIAAGKRLTEALRAIEETSKTVDARVAAAVETLRYRAYAAEATLHRRLGAGRSRQWRVCVLLTESLCRRPWQDVLRAALDAGADCLQLREKHMTDAALLCRAREMVELVRGHGGGASVIVNDRADIAAAAGADGVHLGRDDLAVDIVRRLFGRSLIIGASTHDLDEAHDAVQAGADVCGLGAMFASSLKPDREPSGPGHLLAFVEHYPHVPHLAIGGVTPDNVHELVDAGCRGVAVSSAVCTAGDPGAIVAALCRALPRS